MRSSVYFSRTAGTIRGAASTSVVSVPRHSRVRTNEMPRREAQRIRYRKFGKGLARLRRGESQTQPNQRSIYAPQSRARQGQISILFFLNQIIIRSTVIEKRIKSILGLIFFAMVWDFDWFLLIISKPPVHPTQSSVQILYGSRSNRRALSADSWIHFRSPERCAALQRVGRGQMIRMSEMKS